ncbi:ATP-binding protein [Nocardioides sp.]|uniref:ATP-binding protein n=1 Tax=Nocardioides sp. TaxID=35761 RepID=UPI002BA624A0|nr:ATP-binding protein [Nocardioides sp.]HXH79624.1 ATP-binding protein [Nocardioides sp.]
MIGMSAVATTTQLTLPPEAQTVGRARRAVREALCGTGDAELRDSAVLAVSELVTNAVVHAGTDVCVRIVANGAAVRVEVEDGSRHLPVMRGWSASAGTGRGILIVEEHVDRLSVTRTEHGKVVWFEIGQMPEGHSRLEVTTAPPVDTVEVTLLDVPLLMHWAWQEHAATLLREYLLLTLEVDPQALDHHACASAALSTLSEQLPVPHLPTDPGALMASSVEPGVTAAQVVLHLPSSSLREFEVLDNTLARALVAARDGLLLGPPTQPEISEMRGWLCSEIAGQARGARPVAWRALTDVFVPPDPEAAVAIAARKLAASAEPLIAMSQASVIVAASATAVQFLGYADESELLGRRILMLIPARFHQAHIAGMTLHVTHGRDVLLDKWIDVPMSRSDGTEVMVALKVQPRLVEGGPKLFVASIRML